MKSKQIHSVIHTIQQGHKVIYVNTEIIKAVYRSPCFSIHIQTSKSVMHQRIFHHPAKPLAMFHKRALM